MRILAELLKQLQTKVNRKQIDEDYVYYKTQQMSGSNNKQPNTNEIVSKMLWTTLAGETKYIIILISFKMYKSNEMYLTKMF